MDPQTSKAYRFVRSQSQIDSTLDELFEPEVGEWIRRELLSVSQKPPLPAEASACGRCFRGPDFWVSQEDHDPRGTPEYVQRYCCPVSERALCDQEHQLHPNIQQQITTGQVGLANGNRNNLDPAKTAPKTNASADDDVYDDENDAENKLIDYILRERAMNQDDDDDDDFYEYEQDEVEGVDEEEEEQVVQAGNRTFRQKFRKKTADMTRVVILAREYHEESMEINGLSMKSISWAFQVLKTFCHQSLFGVVSIVVIHCVFVRRSKAETLAFMSNSGLPSRRRTYKMHLPVETS